MKNQPLQKAMIPNITKRKYIKKSVVESIEPKIEIAPQPHLLREGGMPLGREILEVNENDNDIQNKRINNLIKARDARQEKLNNKQSDKEDKVNELVQSITNEQIEKIKIKNDKLKTKLLKLI
jgi:hypothetical protein